MNCPACPMTEDERSIVLRFGTEIVQRTLDTINRVLDGDVALLNESGTFTDFAEVAAFYVKRADNSLAIARRVSAPNADGLCITGSHLTII